MADALTPEVVIVRGSAELVARCRAAVGALARTEIVSIRAVGTCLLEWRPRVLVVPDELHGEWARTVRETGVVVVEVGASEPPAEVEARVRAAVVNACSSRGGSV
jgi:hypothetical protein